VLNFFKRRKRSLELELRPIADRNDPLTICDLLQHPALQAVMASCDDAGAPPSLAWTRLAAGGPIRFDHSTALDAVA